MSKSIYKKQGKFEGAVRELTRRYMQTESSYIRELIQNEYMREVQCTGCGGLRLKPESLSVKIQGRNISEFSDMSVKMLLNFLS